VNKVVSLDSLAQIIAESKASGMKVVHCHGCFDVFHVGHLRHLEEAKSFGDMLVVTITPDRFVNKGPSRPQFNELLRAEVIAGVGVVDYVAINEHETVIDTLPIIRPDIYCKGIEYCGLKNDAIMDEQAAIESIGGRIAFTDGITFSSSRLINTFTLSDDVRDYLKSFKYSYTEVVEWLEKINDLKVLIISETIIDEYQYGVSIGKSGKSPIVAFRLGNKEMFEGGITAIKNHLQDFVSVVGTVPSNVIIKKRYIENNQKLFETYDMDENHPDICELVSEIIGNYDIVLVADFGHGLLSNKLRAIVKQKAKFLAVATQRNAGNMGHNTIRKYWDREDRLYICVDEDELRLAVHEHYSRHHDLSDIIKNELPSNSIITRGSNGCIFNGGVVPALTTNVVDTVGAGDAFLSITSPLMCVGAPIDLVGFVGCVAGAIKVSYMGNKEHITKKDLYNYIKTLLK